MRYSIKASAVELGIISSLLTEKKETKLSPSNYISQLLNWPATTGNGMLISVIELRKVCFRPIASCASIFLFRPSAGNCPEESHTNASSWQVVLLI